MKFRIIKLIKKIKNILIFFSFGVNYNYLIIIIYPKRKKNQYILNLIPKIKFRVLKLIKKLRICYFFFLWGKFELNN